jgi:hypothetical protein
MTETIAPAETPAAESPHLARPHTDAAALRAIEEATAHVHERAQAASDRRAIADHETLIALHEMAKQQLDILNGQDRVLAILDNFASKDMPGRRRHIQDCVDQILAKVNGTPPSS